MILSIKSVTLCDGSSFEIPYADLLPPLTERQFADLKASIAELGIQIPIVVGDDGRVIDGQHRLLAAKELGLENEHIPVQYHLAEGGTSDEEAAEFERDLALTLNLHRRHLNTEDRAEQVAKLKNSGLSNRAIAQAVGVDERTVRRDLEKCSGAANAAPEHPAPVVGSDGKKYSPNPEKSDISSRRERVKEAADEGKSLRAIAKAEGVSLGTVASDLSAIREAEETLPETPKMLETHRHLTPAGNLQSLFFREPLESSGNHSRGQALASDLSAIREAEETLPETPKMLETLDQMAGPATQAEEPAPVPDDEEWLENQRKRVKRSLGLDPDEPAPPRKAKTKERSSTPPVLEPEQLPQEFELKAVRVNPDLWNVVDQLSGTIYGVIERGDPSSHIQAFQGHARVPRDGHLVETRLKYWASCDSNFPSLKAIVEDIEKALADPKRFWEEEARRQDLSKRSHSKWEENTFHATPAPKIEEPFHDIPMEDGAWKNYGLELGSLWLFDSRAKGKGRRGDYHGNCIPQVVEQLLLRYTRKGDVVLDPFAGSGTVAVECKAMGRQYVGIDLDEDLAGRYEEIHALDNPHGVFCQFVSGDSSGAYAWHEVRELLAGYDEQGVDHVFIHPPYWDAVQFGGDREDVDLSKCHTLRGFLKAFQLVAWRALQLLRPGKFLSLVVGDVFKAGHWVPLAAYCMDQIMTMGTVRMKMRTIKNMAGNERASKTSGLQEYRALRDGTSTFKHEEVMVFQKVGAE